VKGKAGREEKEVFAAYLAKNRLKRSGQREVILDAFLRSERHLSVDDLLQIVQKRRPDIGRTTVYRTLKLLQAAGLASELPLQGDTRFEVDYKRAHHDHFICKSCGEIFEFASPEIERIQDEIAANIGFVIEGHRHQIFGLCRRCASRSPREARGSEAAPLPSRRA
jgi:Fur family ferric uptake transcriptional regulator